jgi:hypothetical protein
MHARSADGACCVRFGVHADSGRLTGAVPRCRATAIGEIGVGRGVDGVELPTAD